MATKYGVRLELDYEDQDHLILTIRTQEDEGDWSSELTVLECEENTVLKLGWPHLDAYMKDAFSQVLNRAKDRMGA